MMRKFLRFGIRELHTIVSRDIIKPFSPTPYHLKTYNLSVLDQLAPNAYIPIVAFYPSSDIYQSSHDKTCELKNSLSHTLSQYYPFAGRLAKVCPTYVDCNDEGVEFIEAHNDQPLSEFLQHSEHEDLDQLFPNDLIWFKSSHKGHNHDVNRISTTSAALSVQINYFSCGGVAVATSLSHKIADASSFFNFINHWATLTRGNHQHNNISSYMKPHFISYETRNFNLPKTMVDRGPEGDYITRSFVFPNSKINNLKAKITSMTKESGEPIINPTRAEALTWLIHNCIVAAASKTNLGIFKPAGVFQTINIRDKLVQVLPETSIGNLVMLLEFPTRNETELTPSNFIGELRKGKKAFRSIKDMATAFGISAEMCSDQTVLLETSKKVADYYVYSVVSRFPTYGIDFGWGNPINVTFGGSFKNLIIMMDTPNKDGINVLMSLERQDMNTIRNDPELLAFC